VVVFRPSRAPQVVCSPFGIIRQYRVGSDEQAVSLDADRGRKMGYWRRRMVAVGVVQLCECVEAVFRVDLAAAASEYLVRCRRLVGVQRVRPGEIWLGGGTRTRR
jgi:hypothetical protein